MSSSPDSPSDVAIECDGVCKEFYLYEHRTTTVREWFIRTVRRQPIHVGRAAFTLTDFDVRVRRGEVVGLIGRNGSGKSTALRLIAGIYVPTSGSVETFGHVAAIMQLGGGFSPELTGAENIGLFGAMMGLAREQVDQHRDTIVDFAEIGDFIHTPVKYYSSGMVSRLAFAVTVCVESDILLIDEVLAVGDEAFQRKCIRHLEQVRARGGTIIMASHSAAMLKRLCSRAIWLEDGAIRMDGEVEEVLGAYRASMRDANQAGESKPEGARSGISR